MHGEPLSHGAVQTSPSTQAQPAPQPAAPAAHSHPVPPANAPPPAGAGGQPPISGPYPMQQFPRGPQQGVPPPPGLGAYPGAHLRPSAHCSGGSAAGINFGGERQVSPTHSIVTRAVFDRRYTELAALFFSDRPVKSGRSGHTRLFLFPMAGQVLTPLFPSVPCLPQAPTLLGTR